MSFSSQKDRLLTPFIRLIPSWITPNHFTYARLAGIPFVGWAFWTDRLLLGGVLFLVIFITDALDGTLARSRGQISRLGMALDPIADKLLFFTTWVILGFTLIPIWIFWGTIAMEALLIGWGLPTAHYLKAIGKEYVRSANTFGKVKTALQVPGLLLVLPTVTRDLGLGLLVIGLALALPNLIGQIVETIKMLRK